MFEPLTDGLLIGFRLQGDVAALLLPPMAALRRGDRLWEHSCFELFLKGRGAGYREFNFAADGAWAAYQFSAYRRDMQALSLVPPLRWAQERGARSFSMQLQLPAAALPDDVQSLGLSAILNDADRLRSYWALAHAPGAPNFHHPAAFRPLAGSPDGS